MHRPTHGCLGRLLQGDSQRSIEIGVEDHWVDITFAADRRRISQPLGDTFDRRANVALRGGVRVEVLELLKRLGGHRSAGPGPEIFGGELASADLAQIFVDVTRPDMMSLTVFVKVLEQYLSRQIPTLPDQASQSGIFEDDLVLDTTLAFEFETNLGAGDF